MLPARFGVINDPILRLTERLYERTMADTPNLVRLLEHGAVFHPGCGAKDILGLIVQHPQAIIGRPTSTG